MARYPIKPVDRSIKTRKPGIPIPVDTDRQLKLTLQNIIERIEILDLESQTTTAIVKIVTGGSGLGGGTPTIPGPGDITEVSFVPLFIAIGDIFLIPELKQVLYAMAIDAEGIIQTDGVLVEVD